MTESPYADVQAVVPKLAEPWWYKHVHSGLFFLHAERDANKPLSREGQKVQRRKARKADRRRKAGVGIAGFLQALA